METLSLFLVGVITWPLLEYILHRFSGHLYQFPKVFFKEHQTHHIIKDYFAPSWKKVLAAILFLSILTGINLTWLTFEKSLIFSLGFILMYLFYEWTHYSFHLYAPRTKIGLNLRRHHFSHHFTSPKVNHGVTTTFMDHIFGTYKEVPKVTVPKKFAMNWLIDQNGEVKAAYQKEFCLK